MALEIDNIPSFLFSASKPSPGKIEIIKSY